VAPARRLAGRPGARQLPRPYTRAARGALPLPRWASRLADAAARPDAVLEAAGYLDVLTAAGLSADVWETTYLHVLSGADPVLGWVRSTVLRPALALLDDDSAAEFTAAYAAALREAYPMRPDGTTLLPFRRIFAVGHRPS
jgi:trans-aconitate 2-methyltransferase